MDPLALGFRVAILAAFGLSVLGVWRLDGGWGGRLRARFLLGVPWGTLLAVALVLAVYLFAQNAAGKWQGPLTVPFYSWSYYYPTGWLFAPFAHSGPGHLTGNVVGTLVFAPVAEYAWSHFPSRRGATSFGSWREHPYVRAFVLFPLAVLLVGWATALFHWGPVIGFSGVVFAFAGFALVRYPLVTVVALSARGLLRELYFTVQDPVITASAGPSYGPPWWANVAVEGHLFGLLAGVLLGAAVLGRRDTVPSATRLWVGGVVLAAALSLWALWFAAGGDTYVLFRGPGMVLVAAVGVLVAAAVRATDRPLLPGGDTSRRTVALAVVLVPLLVMALVAVPVNTVRIDDPTIPGEGVEVGNYHVVYAENVPNARVAAVQPDPVYVPVLNQTLFEDALVYNTSGVIVINDEREIWSRQVAAGRLGFFGDERVRVGGVGVEQSVRVTRRGWSAAGSGTVYTVWMSPPEGSRERVFSADPATADLTLAGRNVSVVSAGDQFRLAVRRGNATVGTTPIPGANETRTAGGVRFVREGDEVLAAANGTQVPVATRETYE
jgi:membrane associated rhomboid family serine protease